jgi:hypothetical protein
MRGGLMGQRCATQLNGATVTVVVIAIEQRLGPKRGKWVCRNEATGHRLWRTTRQLSPIATDDA